MLELGVDEMTMVLHLPDSARMSIDPHDWSHIAEKVLRRFENKAQLPIVLGERHFLTACPVGYTSAYCYGDHHFYLACAYHEWNVAMGVIVKFSAQALSYYLQETNMHVYEFLQLTDDDLYTIRLSRIDLTADYFDEDIYPTDIYEQLVNDELAVFRENKNKKTGQTQFVKADVSVKGFAVNEEMPTVYLGSAKSLSQCRIYDKRMEQLQRKGNYYDRAKACNSWIRLEAVFRKEFAHQLTGMLMQIKTEDEMKKLIASAIVGKYRLMQIIDGTVDDDAPYIKMLLQATKGQSVKLQSPTSRTFDIVRNLQYIFIGSGTLPTLYKVKSIWGNAALEELLDRMAEVTRSWEPSSDCKSWLRRNATDTLKAHPDFSALMSEYVTSIL